MLKNVEPDEKILKRLKRAEGQIRGVQKMVKEGCDCESVITQLAAARSAIEGVTGLVLENCMGRCFRTFQAHEYDDMESLFRAIAIWGRIRFRD